ncbi:hypothetical protein PUMCH_000729 [Australozyma saopauloensis]|uniref:Protein kinase domain-containing protein n=1 Tax=Australozyma saopauloensis TaxID=291208 RepID=A0AAX4H4T3_9ASCO|nr:hypothetical protein PUMCH_000729 [[Candida] saopauloensis]
MGFFSRNKASAKTEQPAVSKAPSVTPEPPEETPLQKKRISTILDDVQYDDFENDDYEDDLAPEDRDSDESELEEYEEHKHRFLERNMAQSVSQLSTLMGLCGLSNTSTVESLTALANEELARTYSLLSLDLKIRRLSPTMHRGDPLLYKSVIDDDQIHLIEGITKKLNHVLDMHDPNLQQKYLAGNKTLLDRYGRISKVIGRGSYGVIKVIVSGENETEYTKKNGIYAVKELLKRPATDLKHKEARETFIERVTSEFIVSCTLNNKHLVRTLDLMITVPSGKGGKSSCFEDEIKISQVMECTPGGDLFTYCKKIIETKQYFTIDELDCIIKQVAKGLWYMHNHGVAHCDLKLENILIIFDRHNKQSTPDGLRTRMNVKISDFGKANVFRTKWDTKEQLYTSGPLGSEPYMAPEEFLGSKNGFSLMKKDCWALGIITLVLFNMRRSLFHRSGGHSCLLQFLDSESGELDSKSYNSVYLWHSTGHRVMRLRKYKDPVFEEYTKHCMKADYEASSREWTVHTKGTFAPIETIFDLNDSQIDPKFMDLYEQDADFEEGEHAIRKFFVYKLLDVNPSTRVTVDDLLKGDWLGTVESCGS